MRRRNVTGAVSAVDVEVEVLRVLVAAEVHEHAAGTVLGLDVGGNLADDLDDLREEAGRDLAETGE